MIEVIFANYCFPKGRFYIKIETSASVSGFLRIFRKSETIKRNSCRKWSNFKDYVNVNLVSGNIAIETDRINPCVSRLWKTSWNQLWHVVMRAMASGYAFYVFWFLDIFVDIGMKPAERRTSGLILGRVIYIRMETEPNAFAKHIFFFFPSTDTPFPPPPSPTPLAAVLYVRSIFSTSADQVAQSMSRIMWTRTRSGRERGQLVIHEINPPHDQSNAT